MRSHSLLVLSAAAALLLLAGCRTGDVNPQIAIDRYVQGQLFADEGDMDAALAELAAAVQADPTLSVAYAAAGDIHRKRGNWEAAAESYEDACRTNPFSFKPHYHLGLAYQTLAGVAKAAEQVRHYLLRAVEAYLRANILDPTDADTNLNLAACYFDLGQFDMAEQYCKAAIEINPNDPYSHSNLGVICESQDRLYDAIRAYKASLEIDAHQPQVLMSLGSAYARQNRLKQAVNAYELAAAEDPTDPLPWEQIGSCYYRIGEHDKAEQAYLKAVELGSDGSAAAYRGLGVVYMTQFVLDQTQTELRDKALAAWHSSLEAKPNQKDLQKLVEKYTPAYEGLQL